MKRGGETERKLRDKYTVAERERRDKEKEKRKRNRLKFDGRTDTQKGHFTTESGTVLYMDKIG
jgi:hypothetical protein